ncbi:tetratricopeptide repeat protein [Flavobacterium eburneipallidum]|uniref:tetratricopeptide repeat protein n=1 Tax=Flavobacterium eburneipallidum TaxID=3003263 RepID=UPI0024827412|nr:tetratricopeptide repeat protein [Flavobacterium eburneipallidum]
MKKTVSFFLFLVLLCNSALLLAQTEPEEINSEPDKFEEHFYESLKQKGIENYDKAITELEYCLKLKPNDATVYFELGKNYLASKKYDQSYTSFEKATQIDPKNKWFWVGMYEASYEAKNYTQAQISVNKLIEFDPIYKEDLTSLYMNTQQFDKALVLINELNETIGKTTKRDNYKQQILAQGQFKNTEIDNLISQIDKNPKEESNYINLIRLYLENGEAKKAFEITKKMDIAIPNSAWAKVGMFKYYLDNGENQKAIQSMNVVLSSPNIDAAVKHRTLNEFLNFVNKNPQYGADLEKAIAYLENDPNVNVAKEIGKYFHNKKQWDKAIHYYELSLKNKVDDAEANLLLLQGYVETKQFDLVAKKASAMVELFPSQPQFYYYSGMANNQLQQFKKAKEMLEIGLDYLVDDVKLEVNFNLQLAEAYNGLGDFKKKEQYFSKANQLLKK